MLRFILNNAPWMQFRFRACNFDIDHEGHMVCPNGKRFHFLKTEPVKKNQYGRTEEYYQCEDCTGCPHRERCHKSKTDRIVRINEELTRFHEEVLAKGSLRYFSSLLSFSYIVNFMYFSMPCSWQKI